MISTLYCDLLHFTTISLSQSLIQVLCESRQQNKKAVAEIVELHQKLSEAQGDVRVRFSSFIKLHFWRLLSMSEDNYISSNSTEQEYGQWIISAVMLPSRVCEWDVAPVHTCILLYTYNYMFLPPPMFMPNMDV